MKARNEKSKMKNAHLPRVAIVHDWLYGGGAEKVVEQLHKLYPDAPIYTSYCTDEWREKLDGKVVTGYLQNWPFSKLRRFLPLLRQWWFASLDLNDYDLILSSTGNGEAKFINKSPEATHICYCHTPPHFYYRKYESYVKNPGFGKLNWLARLGLKLLVKPLGLRDYKAAQKVDYFIANSTHIQHDIKKYYGRSSTVIFPPVDTSLFSSRSNAQKGTSHRKPRFIIWGRHVPDKRIDIAIEACNRLELELDIVGKGPETKRLKKIAGDTVTFHGRASDAVLIGLAHQADAFIFTSEEDFGIAPVEALAAGLPVVAYRKGGALDYVVDGITGLFFEQQTVDSLVQKLRDFRPENFHQINLQSKASDFSIENFNKRLASFISDAQSAEKQPDQQKVQ